tara:strand:- start:475 stop:2820 length:2346 start_codon:yes stop_codon:yes gene_type:complete
MDIGKTAVIGAGVMGSGIAAHFANAGIPVVLLDIVPKDAENRNIIAESALKEMLKPVPPGRPSPLMHKANGKLITPGNLEDDLELLKDVDWIVEAVIENLEIKQKVYNKIEEHRKKGSIVSSNTSTIPRAKLVEGMPKKFSKNFMITHFFNPPRYMRLLEIVPDEEVDKKTVEAITKFSDIKLGKEVIICKDTPGFIGNRIGIFWVQCAIHEAIKAGLTVEEADAVMGRPIGVPKTGVFGLMDVVGIDLIPHISISMLANLSKEDEYCKIHNEAKTMKSMLENMIEEGYTGRKGKGGFYRLNKEDGKKIKEARNIETGEYAPANRKVRMRSIRAAKKGLGKLVNHEDKGGQYAWKVLSQTLSYAASLVPEISDSIVDIDNAMKSGYMWKRGPFEMIDQLSAAKFVQKLDDEKRDVPKILKDIGEGEFYDCVKGTRKQFGVDGEYSDIVKPEGYLNVEDIKIKNKPIAKNPSASIWDMGDRIALLEFHSKMNSIDPMTIEMIEKASRIVNGNDFDGLVIGNDGTHFSAGANIGLALFVANVGLWSEMDRFIAGGQQAFMSLKHGNFPVVGAPSGLAIGGGCEVLLACDAVQAHAETYSGLVEVGVGLVPAWGGCKEMISRWKDSSEKGPMGGITRVFQNIGTAKVSTSALEAYDLKILRENDDVTMNRERVLFDAKKKCIELAQDYKMPEMGEYNLAGKSGKVALDMAVDDLVRSGKATPYDKVVTEKLTEVLTGGDTDPTETIDDGTLLDLEKRAIIALAKNEGTADRIEHMMEKGKPLRN